MESEKYSINNINLDEKSKNLLSKIPYIKKAFNFRSKKNIRIDSREDVLRYIFNDYDNRIVSETVRDDNFIIELILTANYLGVELGDYITYLLELEDSNLMLELLSILPYDFESIVTEAFARVSEVRNVSEYSDDEIIFILNHEPKLVLDKHLEFSKNRLQNLLKDIFFWKQDIKENLDVLSSYIPIEDIKIKYLINTNPSPSEDGDTPPDLTLVRPDILADNKYSVYMTFYNMLFNINKNNTTSNPKKSLLIKAFQDDFLNVPLYEGKIIYLFNKKTDSLEEYKIVSLYEILDSNFLHTNFSRFDYKKVDRTMTTCIIEFDKTLPEVNLQKRNYTLLTEYGKSGVRKEMYFNSEWNRAFNYSFYIKVPSSYL